MNRTPSATTSLWRLVDQGLAEPGDDPAAAGGELATPIRATCAIWRRRDDDPARGDEVAEVRRLIRDAAAAGGDPAGVCAFLDQVCAFVEDSRGPADAGSVWDSAGFASWTHDVPERREPADLDGLAAIGDASWALFVAACEHGLIAWRHAIADVVLARSRDVFVAAAHQGEWALVTSHRGRHHLVRNATRPATAQQDAQPREVRGHNPVAEAVGHTLATTHAYEQSLLGPAISVSPAGAAFDAALHSRWSARDTGRFLEGYRNAGTALGFRLERRDLTADRTPPCHVEVSVPPQYDAARGYRSADLDFALCTRSLRQQEQVGLALRERLEALGPPDGTRAPTVVAQAAALACDAADVAPEVEATAHWHLGQTIASLYAAGRYADVVAAVDSVVAYLDALLPDWQRDFLDGLYLVAVSRLAPPGESARFLVDGCAALAGSAECQHLAHCVDLLRAALSDPVFEQSRGDLVRVLIRCQLRRALLEEDARPLVDLLRQLEAVTPAGTGQLTAATRAGVTVLLGAEDQAGRADFVAACADAAGHPELATLGDLLAAFAPRPAPEADLAAVRVGNGIDRATYQALLDEDWHGAARHARADLARGGATGDTATLLCGILARALRGIADTTGDAAIVADEVAGLLDTAAVDVLAAADRSMDSSAERLWTISAGNLGLTAVVLHQRLPRGPFPQAALRLLERAAHVAGRGGDAALLAGCLHDLAHGHSSYAHELPPGEALEHLHRAAALFREVVVLYARLRRQPGAQVALSDREEQVDYFNLGHVHLRIAMLPPGAAHDDMVDGTALNVRAAIWNLTVSRDLCLQNGAERDAARINLQLAQIKAQLALSCLEHTRTHGGAFRRSFQLYLATIEAVPSSTWDFSTRYALSALADVDSALTWHADAGATTGLLPALQQAFGILGLSQLRHGVSGSPRMFDDNLWNMRGMRRATLAVLGEAFDRVPAAPSEAVTGEIRAELESWSRYLAAQMRLENFDARGRRLGDLTDASAAFEHLRDHADPVLRAFARPYAEWFSVSRSGDLVTANGFAMAPAPAGTEITLTAQARSFVIGGLMTTAEPFVLLRESSWVKTFSTGAVASRLPRLDWSAVPALLPVLAGTCDPGPGSVKYLVARLPSSSWDIWVMHLAVADGERLELAWPFRLREIIRRGGRAAADHQLAGGDVAVLQAAGLTLEISIDDGQPDAELIPTATGITLTAGGELRIAVRTTPSVVDTDVTLVVRGDNPFAGGCAAAASSDVLSPTLAVPSSMMRAYAPMLLFDDTVDPRLLRQVRLSARRTVVIAGMPASAQDADRLLGAISDPRREIVWLVESAELSAALAAVDRLTASVEGLCSAPIYAVARSADTPAGDGPAVQVIEVQSQFAPAAVQLALDGIAFRDFPDEDIPTGTGGISYEYEIIGDQGGIRRGLTRLPNPATWDDLLRRHMVITNELPLETVGTMPASILDLYRPLAKRPVLIVPGDRSIVLAATPFARHLGALVLPDEPRSWDLVRTLDAPAVLAVERPGSSPLGAIETPVAVQWLPRDELGIATRFATAAREDHESAIRAMRESGTVGVADELLLKRMEPSAYVVVASSSAPERDAATLAANYAAALGSPLLLFDDERMFSADATVQAGAALSGGVRGALQRDARPPTALGHAELDHAALDELERALAAIRPTYIGFVSRRMTIPVELTGETPLAVRYAVGRLTAPDPVSLSLLITAAARREELVRDARISALVVDAAEGVPGRYLAEAAAEAEHLSTMLTEQARIVVTDAAGPDDRDRFLAAAGSATIVHFCGHGSYSADAADGNGLIFRQGLLGPGDIPSFARTAPIVYANACQSGVAGGAEGLGRAWSGLAAAFIEAGATNYLGSLWPILDSGSRELAERFYALLTQGYSVGESLRRAKAWSFAHGDPTWAAVVLFGCPRNRLRSGDLDRA